MMLCKAIGCNNPVTDSAQDFCQDCRQIYCSETEEKIPDYCVPLPTSSQIEISPAQFRSVEHLDEVDVYAIHHIFDINDPSGALQHASRKLLLSSANSTGRPAYTDILEARDILTHWLELNTTLH